MASRETLGNLLHLTISLTSCVVRRSNGIRGIIPILLMVSDVQSFHPRWLVKKGFIMFSVSFIAKVCRVEQRQSTVLH